MEGKTLVLSVVILSLVLAQVHVEGKSCCPSTAARNLYNACRLTGAPRKVCAISSGCKIQKSNTCRPPNNHATLEDSDDIMKSYCKLGCVSSECNDINALQTSGETFEQCIEECSEFCTNGSTRELEIAEN